MNGYNDNSNFVNGTYGLDISDTITLDEPDLQKAREDRLERTRATMRAIDPLVAQDTVPKVDSLSSKAKAAITIQSHYRGYQGRKLYLELLFQQYEKAEAMRLEKTLDQVEEGQLLVENHQLEVQLDDDATTRKNRTRHYISDIITIQRAWRAYKRRESKLETVLPEDIESIDIDKSGNLLHMSTSTTADSIKNVADCNPQEAWGENQLTSPVAFNQINDMRVSVTNPVLSSPQRMPAISQDINRLTVESECESDYSEMAEPVKAHFAQSRVQIIKRQDLDLCNPMAAANLSPSPEESEEDFAKRIRKLNYLSLAQEFAELKKQNANALPFDLHKGQDYSPSSDGSTIPSSEPSATATPCENEKSIISLPMSPNKETINNSPNTKIAWGETVLNQSPKPVPTNTELLDLNITKQKTVSKNVADVENDNVDGNGTVQSTGTEGLGEFDVFNIETTLPQLDWKALEMQLQKAAEEEKERMTARKNEREEIRRKLAAGFDEEYYDGERMLKKPNLQTRLQSGMNMQICFVNDSISDGDLSESEALSQSPKVIGRTNPFQELTSEADTDKKPDTNTTLDIDNVGLDVKPHSDTESSNISEGQDQDFFGKQAKLQAEARLALAQARPMAKMQLEIEKQMKKSASIAEQVGIFGDGKRKKLSPQALNQMNLAQIQVLVNDIHTQIENLNEELVNMLVERDDLHMEQDSMLVDIEDLTRRAQELADKVNEDTSKKAEKEKSNKKKQKRKIFS